MPRPRLLLRLAALVAAAGLPACYSIVETGAGYQRQGVWLPARTPSPPAAEVPPAPVAAERLRWLPERGVYALIDEPCLYYRLRTFYRRDVGGWSVASQPDGPWQPLALVDLPAGLADLTFESCRGLS